MTLSLLDINAGDTIQAMVEKINYNFDQLQANGGGPRGIQGEQGPRGNTGQQGPQGERGDRGCAWYTIQNGTAVEPDPEEFPPQSNDIGLDSNGNIYMYDGDSWELVDGFNLTASLNGAFRDGGSRTIVARDGLRENFLALGSVRINEELGDRPSLAVCFGDLDCGHSDGIEFFSGEISSPNYIGRISSTEVGETHSIDIKSRNKVEITAMEGLGMREHSLVLDGLEKSVKWTGFAGMTQDATVFPLLAADSRGRITTGVFDGENYGYKWSMVNGSDGSTILRPNSGDNASFIGYLGEGEAIGGLVLGMPNDMPGIICSHRAFTEAPNRYEIIMSGGVVAASAGWGVGLHLQGITVGTVSVPGGTGTLKPADDGLNTFRKGISIYDKTSAGGMLCMTSSGAATDYIQAPMSASDKTFTTMGFINCTGTLNMKSTYRSSLQNGSQYGSNPIITLKPNMSTGNRLGNQLTIKGGKYGSPVSISGGRGYSQRGGDIYISAGDVLIEDPEATGASGDSIKFKPFLFGDVVIGVNPENHYGYYSECTGVTDGSDRGVNDHKNNDNLLDFYDINNFTAHANNIWLNSDAQSRAFRPSAYGVEYPSVSDARNLTFNVGGLCTMHHGETVTLSGDDIYKYQMMSGRMCYIVRKRLVNNQIKTTTFSRRITENPVNGDFYSMAVTDWIKVGNMVQCSARISNYYYYNGGYYVLADGVDYTSIPLVTEIVQNRMALIANLTVPVAISGEGISTVTGHGTLVTERKGSAVDGAHFIVGMQQVVFEKGGIALATYSNARHDTTGKIIAGNPLGSTAVWPTDINSGTYTDVPVEDVQTAVDALSHNVPFISPMTILDITAAGNEYHPLSVIYKLFSCGMFTYTYMLNPGFKYGDHIPFRASSNKFPISPAPAIIAEPIQFINGALVIDLPTGGDGGSGGSGGSGKTGGNSIYNRIDFNDKTSGQSNKK